MTVRTTRIIQLGKNMKNKNFDDIIYILELSLFDITEENLIELDRKLQSEFTSPPSIYDTVWRALNDVISETSDFNKIGLVYRKMAIIAEIENKDHSQYLEAAHDIELKKLQIEGVKEVEVEKQHNWKKQIARNKICDEGRKIIGKKFPLDVAVTNKPIPSQCSKGAKCICRYKPSDNDSLKHFEKELDNILDLG